MKAMLILIATMVIVGLILFCRAWNAPVVFKEISTGNICACIVDDTMPSKAQCEQVDLNQDLYEVVWTQVCP